MPSVNHEALVDFILKKTKEQGIDLDPMEVMQIAGQGLKANGYNPTADDFGKISDVARARVGTPTKNEQPGVFSGYGDEVANTFGLAGKKIQQGATTAVASLLNSVAVPNPYGGGNIPLLSPEYRDALASDAQARAHDIQTRESQIDPLSNFGANALAYINPATTVPAAFGDTTNKAVAMQDQGKDITSLPNRIDLGVTGGTNAAMGLVPMASALGKTGWRAAGALAGTGVASNLASTVLQGGTDYATGNEGFAPRAEDYALSGVMGLLPAAHAVPRVMREARGAREALAADNARISELAPLYDTPASRGADVVPAPVGDGVIPAAELPRIQAERDAQAQRELDQEVRDAQAEKDLAKEALDMAAANRVAQENSAADANARKSLLADGHAQVDQIAKDRDERIRLAVESGAIKRQLGAKLIKDNRDWRATAHRGVDDGTGMPEAQHIENTLQAPAKPARVMASARRAEMDAAAEEATSQPPIAEPVTPKPVVDQPSVNESAPVAEPVTETKPVAEPTPAVESPQAPEAPINSAPEVPQKRYIIESATGKPRLVTERMPTEGETVKTYDELTPKQRNYVDVQDANRWRKTVGRNKTESGAAINPGHLVVEGVKAGGRLVKPTFDKAVELVHGAGIGAKARLLREVVGESAVGRLLNSPDARVQKIGRKFQLALEEGRRASQSMHEEVTKAERLASTTSLRDFSKLREANTVKADQIKGKGYGNSHLWNVLHGTEAPSAPILSNVKDAYTTVNKVTHDHMSQAGVPINANTRQGKDIVVRYTAPQAERIFKGEDVRGYQNMIKMFRELNPNKDGSLRSYESVAADFPGEGVKGLAVVQRNALELKRKYPNAASHVMGDKGPVQLFDLDPRSYVHRVAKSAADRIGMVKGFGSEVTAQEIGKSLIATEKEGPVADNEQKAVHRSLEAYNSASEGIIDNKKIERGIQAVKGLVSAMRASAAAPANVTEILNLAGQVPVKYIFTGLAKYATTRGVAVHEGGMAADVKNIGNINASPLTNAANVASSIGRRVTLRTLTDRGTQSASYMVAKDWAEGMREQGKLTPVDLAHLEKQHISPEVRRRFSNGQATDSDVLLVAKSAAENFSGVKGNMAESGRLSRWRTYRTAGMLFTGYAENRVRNLIRSGDAIAHQLRAKNYEGAGRMALGTLVGTGLSAVAATAVGQILRYGIEGLRISIESGEWMPFLGNVLGGGMIDAVTRLTDSDNPWRDAALALAWPLGAAYDMYRSAKGDKSLISNIPAARIAHNAATGADVSAEKAYSAYMSARGVHLFGGSSSEESTQRRDFKRALLRGEYAKAERIFNDATADMSRAESNAWVRKAKTVTALGDEKEAEMAKKIGHTAYSKLLDYDDDVESFTVRVR